MYKAQLISVLDIPSHLTDSGDISLQTAYQKYKAYLLASQTVETMMANNAWMIKRPTQTDLIELFVSKSYYHSHYKRFFSQVAQYLDMVAWLENQPDQMSDIDVWGIWRTNYTFMDLKVWLKNGGMLESEDEYGEMGKGKGKGLKKERKNGKGKGKETEKEGKGKGKEREVGNDKKKKSGKERK